MAILVAMLFLAYFKAGIQFVLLKNENYPE